MSIVAIVWPDVVAGAVLGLFTGLPSWFVLSRVRPKLVVDVSPERPPPPYVIRLRNGRGRAPGDGAEARSWATVIDLDVSATLRNKDGRRLDVPISVFKFNQLGPGRQRYLTLRHQLLSDHAQQEIRAFCDLPDDVTAQNRDLVRDWLDHGGWVLIEATGTDWFTGGRAYALKPLFKPAFLPGALKPGGPNISDVLD